MSTPVIISSWLGDNNQTYGLLGLGFIASGATLPTTLDITAGASASFSVALAANVALNINAAAGAGVTGAGGVTPGAGGFGIPQGTFTPIFASGFDFPVTPLVHWNGNGFGGAAVATIVAGANGNGAIPGGSGSPAFLHANHLSPVLNTLGVRVKFTQFTQDIVAFNTASNTYDGTSVMLIFYHVGDGRLRVRLASELDNHLIAKPLFICDSATGTGPGYVAALDEWVYLTIVTVGSSLVIADPFPATTSRVAIDIGFQVKVNGVVVWTDSIGINKLHQPNGAIPDLGGGPPGLGFREVSLCSSMAVFDDVYLNNGGGPGSVLGDVKANPDDLTVTSYFSDPAQTQILQELYGLNPSDPEFTQILMEVYGKGVSYAYVRSAQKAFG